MRPAACVLLLFLPAAATRDALPGLVAEVCDTQSALAAFPGPADAALLFLRRIEPQIDHASTNADAGGFRLADSLSVKWTGLVRIAEEADWTFTLESDDGSRLAVDGKPLLDNGGVHGMTEKSGTVHLAAGDHPIVVEWFEGGGAAGIRLLWSSPSRAKEVVPASALFHPRDEWLDRPAASEDVKLRWKLEPNQFARYRVWTPRTENGRELLDHDPHWQRGLFGFELEDKRVYNPQHQTVREIPHILAQTLPERALHTGRAVDLDVILDRGYDYEPTRAKGKVERLKGGPGGLVTYSINARLAGLRGKAEARQIRVKEGSVAAEADFDADRGLLTRLRFTFAITLEGQKPAEWVREMRLVDVHTRRHATFESEVNRAIDAGVNRLWGWLDAKTGHWGEYGDFKEGPSAIALLAILKCSIDRNDPRLVKAFEWYLNQLQNHIYSVAIGMMAVEAWYSPADPARRFTPGQAADKDIASRITAEHKDWMQRAANFILTSQRDNYWAYPNGTQDYSNTQYAVLGLLAAQRCGVAIEDGPLVATLNRVLQSQERKGPAVKLALLDDSPGSTQSESNAMALGWAYRDRPEGDGGPRASMTAGAVGTLTILDAMLSRMGSAKYKGDLRAKVQAAIRNGWAWLADNWSPRVNWNCGRGWLYYALYALERAAMLGGVAAVNGHDWYWEGACWLLANMAGDGAWCDQGYVNLHDTAFAVLFLKRATVRVATGEKK